MLVIAIWQAQGVSIQVYLRTPSDLQALHATLTGRGSPNWFGFHSTANSCETGGSHQDAPQFDPLSKIVMDSVVLHFGQVK